MAIRFLLISTSDISIRRSLLYAVLALLAACAAIDEQEDNAFAYLSTDTHVSSRGVSIPVTLVLPASTSDETFPLVVMAHGHGGTRHENGAFKAVAERLAENGVASVRMDFPGCGDSTEAFSQNNIGNMLADILASRDYAIGHAGIDRNRVGLFGWSMGGRLVLLLGDRNDEFKAIATWTPAATDGAGSMISFLGGKTDYEDYRRRAVDDGAVPFTTQWGQDQQLGSQWFIDLENSKPLMSARQFEGPILVLYGDQDNVVLPEVSEAVIEAAVNSREVIRHVIEGADHGLGIYSGEKAVTGEVIATTVQFFSGRLTANQ